MNLQNMKCLDFQINEDGEKVFYVKTPCKFIIEEQLVQKLKHNYLPDEEIGGMIWFKPNIGNDGEVSFIGNKVSFIRNAIMDFPFDERRGRTQRNAYYPDLKERSLELNKIIASGCLPIFFHTHPTKGELSIEETIKFSMKRETSLQDRRASDTPFPIGGEKLIMPSGLIVGNDRIGDNLFIGLYNGNVAPKNFEKIKTDVIEKNVKKAQNKISENDFSVNQKILIAIGGVLFLIAIYKIWRNNPPLINKISDSVSSQFENTGDEPNFYYCQISKGEAIILIPEIKDE